MEDHATQMQLVPNHCWHLERYNSCLVVELQCHTSGPFRLQGNFSVGGGRVLFDMRILALLLS
jgi:hypothetical protein